MNIKHMIGWCLRNWYWVPLSPLILMISPFMLIYLIVSGSIFVHGRILHWAYDGVCPGCNRPRTKKWNQTGDYDENKEHWTCS